MRVMIQVGEVWLEMSFRLDCKHPDNADELSEIKDRISFSAMKFRLILL